MEQPIIALKNKRRFYLLHAPPLNQIRAGINNPPPEIVILNTNKN